MGNQFHKETEDSFATTLGSTAHALKEVGQNLWSRSDTISSPLTTRLEIHIYGKKLKVPIWDQSRKQMTVREIHWTPKWYEKRVIPIESRLEPVLREFHEQQTDNIYGIYFLGSRGTLSTDHISRQIKSLTGKQDLSVHTFRHTHISHALNRWGRHPSVVRDWVGHRDLKTTMQYLHVCLDDLHREAKRRVSRAFLLLRKPKKAWLQL